MTALEITTIVGAMLGIGLVLSLAILKLVGWTTRRRHRAILTLLEKGECSSRALREVAGPLVYLDLQELEDDGLIISRVAPGGPERGYRERVVYRLAER